MRRWMFLVLVGCASPHATTPPTTPTTPAPSPACSAAQLAISDAADQRATPYNITAHLAKNFPDGRVAWLMPDAKYQKYVVEPKAQSFGRCVESTCYLFAAPASVIHDAVHASLGADGHHDPAALGKALGLPATNLEGPLKMMTLDVRATHTCARFPVDEDPGVWKCKSAEDTDCFKFGGYTSGGLPEIMVIDARVERATIEDVP